MSSIGATYHISETHILRIKGEEGFNSRIVKFFRDYFAENNPREKRNFHLRSEGKYYLVKLELEHENPENTPEKIYEVKIVSYELARRMYSGVPNEEQFIEDLKKMRKIPRQKVRPLDPPSQGFLCDGIPFFYSYEFQIQMAGEKSGTHHVSLGDHSISEKVLETVLVKTAKKIKTMKNKPLGRVTKYFLVDSTPLSFSFDRHQNGSCTIISMFYPSHGYLKYKLGYSSERYEEWLKNLPQIHL